MQTLQLAFGWFPEVKGWTVVIIGALVMIGGSYLIVATNIGGRLGLLVTMAGLFGWMASMGIIWWAYGIGLQGRLPTWKPQEIITGDLNLARYDVARNPNLLTASEEQRVDGWILLNEADPKRGQTVASADAIIQEAGVFAVGDYEAEGVYDFGGERWPNISFDLWEFGTINLDYLAVRHKPHYSIVSLQPLVKQATEPGKAPPSPIVDESQPTRYVLMIRDMGSKRQPAVFITIGSSIIFGLLCYMLHKRDQLVAANRSRALVPATGGD
jgi:hypothetical protein